MKRSLQILGASLLYFFVFYFGIWAQPPVGISVNVGLPADPIDRAALIETLFGPGTNVDPNSVQVNCPNTAIGTFTNGQAMGFQGSGKGIIMTTGSAIVAQGPNNLRNAGAQSSAGACSGSSGDPDLEALPGIGAGQTRDACSIEFNVQFSSSILQINNYIFASEEYPEYVNSNFNDVFAFLISAPGQITPPYGYQSISLIPPTFTQPVAINTINQGPCCQTPTNPPNPPFQNCNCGEYISNTLSNGDPNNNPITQYDGYTKPFYTTLNVIPLTWYHFKFVIADRFDCIFDSAILIQTEAVVGFGADPLPPPALCADGKPRPMPYTAAGTLVGGALAYSPQNVFTLEMSDINGNFTAISNPPNTPPSTVLGTYTGNQLNGHIMATVPVGTPPGSGYKLRIRTLDTNPTPPLTNPFLTYGFPKNNQSLTITPPVDVTAGSDSPKCTGEVLSLTASATPSNNVTYEWKGPAGFTSTLANPTRSGLTTAHAGVYTVIATINGGCSDTATVNVTVSPAPGIPAGQSSSRCGPGVVTFTATMGTPPGNQMLLFTQPNGGLPISTSSTPPYELATLPLNQTATYYIAAYNAQTGCSSPRAQVIATIHPIPANPTANPPDLSRCGPGAVTFSVNMGSPAGSVVNLYTSAQGGVAIASDNSAPFNLTTPSITSNATYYVEAATSNCSSSRLPVTVTVLPVPGQPMGVNQERCGPGVLTLPLNMGSPAGSQILLYSVASGGTPISTFTTPPFEYTTPNLAATTTYYIESVSNSTPQCTSSRVSVIATIHPNPTAPSINPVSVNVCGSGNSATFTVNMGVVPGNIVRLYDQPTGGTMLDSDNTPEYTLTTPNLVNNATFYVEVVNGVTSCVSSRTPVNVSIIPIPTPPVATPTNIEICGSGQVTFTATMTGVSGDFIRMYTLPTGGTVIASDNSSPYELTTPNITTTTTFYFEVATSSGCASARSEAVALVNPLPESPSTSPLTRCGPGGVTITATLTNSTNLSIQLYTAPTGGNFIEELLTPPYDFTISSVSSNITYYLQTRNLTTNCLSPRIPVPITVHPIVNEPTANSPEICGSGVLTFTVTLNPVSGGNIVFLYTAPTGGAPIATDNISPYTLSTPSITTTATFYIESLNSVTGCRSNRAQAIAVVNPNPSAPISSAVERCGPGAGTFTAQMGAIAGNRIYLFDAPAGGTPIATAVALPYQLNAPSVTTTTNFYLQAHNTTTGCSSSRSLVSLIISPKPTPPTGFAGSRCGTGPVTFSLNIEGNPPNMAVRLYTTPTTSVIIDEDQTSPYVLTFPDLSTTTTLYVSSFSISKNCESDRVPIVATLTPFPDKPVPQGVAERCGPGTLSLTVGMGQIQGDAIRFFDAPSGGQLLATIGSPFNSDPNNKLYAYPTAQLTNTTTFWAEALNTIPNCTSLQRTPVVAVINPIPGIPLVPDLNRCGPGSVTFTGLPSSPMGQVLRIYSSLGAITPLGSSSTPPYSITVNNIATNSTFFAAMFNPNTGCESGRAPVEVTIFNFPDQPIANNVARCGGGMVTFTATQGFNAGNEIYLYDSPNSPTPLVVANTPPFLLRATIENTSTFYISAFNTATGCESPKRSVEAKVNPFPDPPTPQTIARCGSGILSFTILPNFNNANQINVYSSITANVPAVTLSGAPYLFTTPSLTQTTTFYATSVNSATGCESKDRTPIQAIINLNPSAPEIEETQRCGPGSVTFSITMGNIPGTQVRLYTTNPGTIPSFTDNSFPYEITTGAINATTTFYFDVYNESTGCVSPLKSAIARVISLPGAPSVTNASRCGEGEVVILGEMGLPQGTALRMYDALIFGNLISSDNVPPFELNTGFITSTTTYFVESFDAQTGCSGARTPVVATILPLPGAPPAQVLERCGPGSFSFTSAMGNPAGNLIGLYDSPLGGTPLMTVSQAPYAFNTPTLSSSTTFYLEASNTLTGCRSNERTPIQLIINQIPSPPISSNFQRCQAGIISVTAQMGLVLGTEIRLYSTLVGGTPISSDAQPPYELSTSSIASSRTFYLESINTFTGCASERLPIIVTILEAPGVPIATDVTRCGPGPVTLTVAMASPVGDIIRTYDAPVGGNLIAVDYSEPFIFTHTITATRTYYIESYNSQTGCVSARKQVFAVAKSLPGLPIVEDVHRCGAGEVSFTVSIGAPGGTEVRLYASFTSGNTIISSDNSPYVLSSPFVNTTTTFYFSSFDAATGCESSRVEAKAIINPVPAIPGALNVTACVPAGSLQPVTFTAVVNNPTGTILNLYTQQNAGQAVSFTATPPYLLSANAAVGATSTFYIEAVFPQTGCASKRAPVLATLNPIPLEPQAQNLNLCGAGSVTITANFAGQENAEIRLYTSFIGTNPVAFDFVSPYELTTPFLTQTTTLFLETYIRGTGCASGRTPVLIAVNPIPTLPAANNDGPKCAGQMFRLFINNPSNNITYRWIGPNNFAYEGTQTFASLTQTSVYSVIAITEAGCSSQAATTLAEVNPTPVQPIVAYYDDFGNSIHYLCEGKELNLMVVNYPQYPEGTIFLWEGPNNYESAPHPFPARRVATLDMAGIYSVRAVYKNCTSAAGDINVEIYRKPKTPIASNNSPLCVGQQWLTLQASDVPGAHRYIWNGPNNFEAVGQLAQRPVELLNAGLYTVFVETEQGCRSEKAETEVIIYNNQFNLAAQTNEPVCEGSPLIITMPHIVGGKFIWQGPQGVIDNQSNRLAIPQAQISDGGVYQVRVAVGSCTSQTVTLPITVRSRPLPPTFIANSPVCSGQNLTFQTTNTTPLHYVWSGPNQFNQQGIATSFIKNNAIFADNGLYSVVAVANGCSSQPQVLEVNVVELPNKPLATNTGPVCIGETVTLIASGSFNNYIWQGPNGFTATGPAVEITINSVNQGGSYTVTSVVNGNCRSSSSVTTVSIKPSPRLPVASTNSPVCMGNILRLTASPIINGKYLWQGPLGFVAQTSEVSLPISSLEQAGLYSLQVIQGGCTSATALAPVVVYPLPEIWSTGSNSPLCVGAQLILSAVSNNPNATFIWRGPNGFVFSDVSNITIRNNVKQEDAGLYTVTAILNGCSSEAVEIPVAVRNTPLPPTISGNTRFCEGETLNLLARGAMGSTFIWTGPNGYTSTGAIATRSLQSTVEGGTYQVRAVVNGCTSQTAGINVLVLPAPAAPRVSPQAQNRCIGEQAVFSASHTGMVSYLWEGPNGFSATGSVMQRLITTPQDEGVYTVTAVANGCSSSANATLVVNHPPNGFNASANSPLCVGQTLNLNAEQVNGALYQWTGPNGFVSTQRNPSIMNVNPQHSGSYYVSVIIGNCTSASRRVEVAVNERPVAATASASNRSICSGSTLNLSANTVVGASYYWSGPSGFTSNEQTPSIANIQTHQGGVYAVQTILGGCTSNVSSINISVIEKPRQPVILAPARLCVGQTLQLNTPTVVDVTYRWVGPNGFITAIQNPIRNSVTTADGGRYTLTLERRGCLSEPATVQIDVFPAPIINALGNNSPLCAGETLTLTAPFFENATYFWAGPNGFTSSEQNPTLTNVQTNMAGVYSLSIAIGACTTSAPPTWVNVLPSPNNLTLSANTPLCSGNNLELRSSFLEGVSYFWQGPNGFRHFEHEITLSAVSTEQSGVYTLTARLGNCSTIKTLAIDITQTPSKPSIHVNSPVCAFADLLLSAPTISGATYFWQGPSGFLSTQQNPIIESVDFNRTGEYSLSVAVGGCVSEVATLPIRVQPLPGRLLVSATDEICSGETLLLNVNVIAGATYRWAGPNNFSSTLINPFIINAQPENSGVYTVNVKLGDCSSEALLAVNIKQRPIIRGISSNAPLCVGGSLALYAPILENAQYVWRGPNGYASSDYNPVLENVTMGASGNYSLTIIANGCSSVNYVTPVIIQEQPNISIAGNRTVCAGSALTLSVQGITNATVKWSGPSVFSSSAVSIQKLNVTPLDAGVYSVEVQENNCPAITASVNVQVLPRPGTPLARANSPICEGNELKLETPLIGGARYIWSGPNNFQSTLRESLISRVTTANSGIYSVAIVQNGCTSGVGTVGVTVLRSPGLLQASNSSPACVGQAINLTANTIAGARYQWSGPAGFTSESQNPVLVANNNTSGVYSVIAYVGICSSNTATTTVTLNQSPANVIASSNSPVCAGNAINLNVTSVAGAQYEWQGPNSYMSVTQNPTIANASVAAAGLYSVIVRIGNCSTSAEVLVQVQPSPTISAVGNNGPICSNNTLNLSVEAPANASIRWTGPNGFSSTLPNPFLADAQPSQSGIYSVMANIGNCFSAVHTTQVVIRPTPMQTISSNAPLCENASLFLQTTPTSGAQYAWQGPADFNANGSSVRIDNIKLVNSGVYSLLTVLNGCSAISKTTVQVKPNPVLGSIGSNAPVCTGNTLQFTAPFIAGARYQWLGVNGFSSAEQNPTITNVRLDNQGSYSLFVIVEGCTSAVSQIGVSILASPSAPFIPAEVKKCAGQDWSFGVQRVAGLNYYWRGPHNWSAEGNTFSIPNLSGVNAGPYTLQVSDGQCSSQPATVNLLVQQVGAKWAQNRVEVCAGSLAQLPIELQGVLPINLQYNVNGLNNSIAINGGSFNLALMPSSSQIVTLTSLTDAQGCSARLNDTARVIVHSLPKARWMRASYETCQGELKGAAVIISETNGRPWRLAYKANDNIKEINGVGDGVFEAFPSQFYGTENLELLNIFYTDNSNPNCNTILDGVGAISKIEFATPPNWVVDQVIRTDCNAVDSVRFVAYGKGPWVVEYTSASAPSRSLIVGSAEQAGPRYFTLAFAEPGVYRVVKVTDGRGCSQNLAIDFEIAPKRALQLRASVLQSPSCFTASGKILAVGVGSRGDNFIYALNGGAFESLTGIFENLPPGIYEVSATNGTCVVKQSVDLRQIAAPQILSVEPGPQSLTVQWLPMEGAQGYTLSYRQVGAQNWQDLPVTSLTSQTVNGLQANTMYEFTVIAVCAANQWSPRSAPASGVTLQEVISCRVPEVLNVEAISSTSLQVTFGNRPSGGVCYILSYGLAGAPPDTWNEILAPVGAPSFTIAGLTPGEEYELRVRTNCSICSARNGDRSVWTAARRIKLLNTKGLEASSGFPLFSLYPNPNNGVFSIEYAINESLEGSLVLDITDLLGKVYYKQSLDTSQGLHYLTISHLSPGIYNCRFTYNGRSVVYKAVAH
jgi:hypothetical protein